MRRSDDPTTRGEAEEIAVPERVRTREEVETSTGARPRTRRQNGRGGSEKGVYDCVGSMSLRRGQVGGLYTCKL